MRKKGTIAKRRGSNDYRPFLLSFHGGHKIGEITVSYNHSDSGNGQKICYLPLTLIL